MCHDHESITRVFVVVASTARLLDVLRCVLYISQLDAKTPTHPWLDCNETEEGGTSSPWHGNGREEEEDMSRLVLQLLVQHVHVRRPLAVPVDTRKEGRGVGSAARTHART